eukprot:10142636-Lingulodinium_polyedra.AAC.1
MLEACQPHARVLEALPEPVDLPRVGGRHDPLTAEFRAGVAVSVKVDRAEEGHRCPRDLGPGGHGRSSSRVVSCGGGHCACQRGRQLGVVGGVRVGSR